MYSYLTPEESTYIEAALELRQLVRKWVGRWLLRTRGYQV